MDAQRSLKRGLGAAAAVGILKLVDQRFYLSSDLRQLWQLAQVKLAVDSNVRNNVTSADLFERVAAKDPSRPMFLFEGREVSFGEVDRQSNRLAHWLTSTGVRKGDVVALFMENRPEYVITWLAVAKIGAVTALINHNLRRRALRHSVHVVRWARRCGPRCGCYRRPMRVSDAGDGTGRAGRASLYSGTSARTRWPTRRSLCARAAARSSPSAAASPSAATLTRKLLHRPTGRSRALRGKACRPWTRRCSCTRRAPRGCPKPPPSPTSASSPWPKCL